MRSKPKTKDTVPVTVDAVVYWTAWDAEKAALAEIQEKQKIDALRTPEEQIL